MRKMIKATPREDYFVEILLENGNSIIIGLKEKLRTVRFSMLRDQDYFNQVVTDGIFLRWNCKIEISFNEILQWLTQ